MHHQVELGKVSVAFDNSAIFAGKYSIFSPLASEIYQVPSFMEFVTIDSNRILIIEEQSGDLVEMNIKEKKMGQRIKGKGRCKGNFISLKSASTLRG